MSTVNERWQRWHNDLKKLGGYLGVLSAGLWPLSYEASLVSANSGPGMWFTTVCVVTLVGAIGTTIGVTVLGGIILIDNPPFEGDNRY